MASHSEGPPYPASFVETHGRRSLQHYSDSAGGTHDTLSQCSDSAASACAPNDVSYAFQSQYCDFPRTHQPHSSLQSDAPPVFSQLDTQSTCMRETATSPLRSIDLRQTSRDVNVSRTDYLRALTSIVMNHSAKMSAQSPKKQPTSPIKRAVYNSHTTRNFVPRYLQRRTLLFQGPRSMRTSLQPLTSDWRTKMRNLNRNQAEITDPSRNGSNSLEKSKPTELSLTSSKDLKNTPPVLVQCSGEIVTRNCELMKERPQLPSSEVPEISGMIYTKCEDFPNNPPETSPILVQCIGETIEQRCVQVQTLPSSHSVNEKAESPKSATNEEKARNVKRKKPCKTAIGKIGFSKSFFLSKKRARRPETRRIKATLRNTDQPSESSDSTPSGGVHESHSSKAASLRDQTGDVGTTSSAKRRVTFSEERGKEVRHRRFKKKRKSKSVSGNAQTSKSFKPQKAENPTQLEATLNHLKYTGKKGKQCLVQAEKNPPSNTSPEVLPSGLSRDEHMSSLNSQNPLQTPCVTRCSLIQNQMYPYSNAGIASDPRYNSLMKREKDMHSFQIKTSKHTGVCNQTVKANFMNKSRFRDYRSATNSIETCKNDIKRLAEVTRCFLKHRKRYDVSEKTQNLPTRGYPYTSETEVNTPPALPPEESTMPVLSSAAPYKVGQRCDEIVANVLQKSQEHSPPTQPSKVSETPGPFSTTSLMQSTGKKSTTSTRYSSSKRRRDFKNASKSKSTKSITHASNKRGENNATHHEKKLSSLEVVEQWLHSSAASSMQGDAPEPLLSVEEGLTDSQLRPTTKDMAVMATPRMMRQSALRNRRVNSRKQKSSPTMSPRKTKPKKPNVNTNNLDANALRYKSIDAHARCLELLENSSYSLTSEMSNQLKPKNVCKQSIRSKRKTQMPSTDVLLHRVLQENKPSSCSPEQGTLVYNVHDQMTGTAQQSAPNMNLKGNAATNVKRMRFVSMDPKIARGKTNKMPIKGVERDAKAVSFQSKCKVVERNGDRDIDCPVNMQTNAGDRTRLPDMSQAVPNLARSAISTGYPQSNFTANGDEAKQTNEYHEVIVEERVNDNFLGHGTKTGRHGMSFWPKRRVSVCCKRLGGMSRRFRALQRTDSSRKGTPTASSGVHGLEQMGNDSMPNFIENKGPGRVNAESEITNHISGTGKESMSATMEKLSRITHWNSSQRLGSHSSVSSRKTELSSYSDVSGSTFSDTGKSNNCISTRGLKSSVLMPNATKSQGQEAVSTISPSGDLPHLVVQCMGGTITPHPLPNSSFASPSLVPKTAEGKEKGNQEENSSTKDSPHMVLSISWGGTSCSLQCQKGPSSQTTQVITLPTKMAKFKDGSGNVTTEAPSNFGQYVPGENETKRRQKGLATPPGKSTSKRGDASKCKVKAGRPNSRAGTPKMKQQSSVPNANWGTSRRGNPQANLAGNPKAGAQSKKDKAAVDVKCSDSSPPVPTRGMRQRSKPTLPGPPVMIPSSPCGKASPPPKKNAPLSRSVGPSRGQIPHKSGEQPGKDRKASVSETVDASVQVSRQDSGATTPSRKGSSHIKEDKKTQSRKTSASRQKSAGTSPKDSSKLVEAYVQTSQETPVSGLKSVSDVKNQLQKNSLGQNVAVSVQTSGVAIPEKADVSFQTSVSRMLLVPKPPTNLTSADFFKQTQRYLSNVACVLASQKKKVLSLTEEETPKKSEPPAELEIILPERKRREPVSVREKSQESSSSSRATSTADASIHSPKSSRRRSPQTSSVLIQRTLRDAAHLLQRHRSLSAPQAPVADKHHALMMEQCGMRGPPPWPVRSSPVRECDTPSAAVTSESTSTTSSLVQTSESRSYPSKLSAKDKDRIESIALYATNPLLYSDKFKKSPSLPLKRSPNTSQCVSGSSHNVYGYQRRGDSSSGSVNRSDKVGPQWRKRDLGNATSPKGRSVNPNRTPIKSPTKAYVKIHPVSDPIKPPLPPPRKLSTSPPLMPSRSFNISSQSTRAPNPTPRRLVQILQARNPVHPKPMVMRRSKKMGSKMPIRKARKGSVKAKKCVPVMETAAATAAAAEAAATAAVRAVVDSESSTPRSVPKQGGTPEPGNKEKNEAGPQLSKAPDEKAPVLTRSPASASHAQRSRSTGATAPRVRQGPGSLLVVMPRVTDSVP